MHELPSPQHVTDETLCESIARRDSSSEAERLAREACGELYTRHARGLLAFLATRAGRSDAEDVHQAVWQKVWQSVGQGFSGGNFRAWLFQIARNHMIDASRKKRPGQMSEDHDERDVRARRPDEVLADEERRRILAQCLEKLETRAAMLVQARLQGESYEAICERLDIPADRAHRLFHSAKQNLQKCVNQDES